MNHRLVSLNWTLAVTAALTAGACTAVHNIGDNPNGTGGSAATGGASAAGGMSAAGGAMATGGAIATGGSGASSCPSVEPHNGDSCTNIGLYCSYGAFSCPYHFTCNTSGIFERSPASGCFEFPPASGGSSNISSGGASAITASGGASSVPSLASRTLAQCNIPTVGVGNEQSVTVPSALTDANWGVKAANCEQGGWNLAQCAGQQVMVTSFATGTTNQWGPITAWVVTSGSTVCCVYETENSVPGVLPAPCGAGGAPGAGGTTSAGGASAIGGSGAGANTAGGTGGSTCTGTLANFAADCPATLCEAKALANDCANNTHSAVVGECGDCSTPGNWAKCYEFVKFEWGTHRTYCYYGPQADSPSYQQITSLTGATNEDDVTSFCDHTSRSISAGNIPASCDVSGATQIDCHSGPVADASSNTEPAAYCHTQWGSTLNCYACCADPQPDCTDKPDGYGSCIPGNDSFCACSCDGGQWLCAC